jgi:hypothetical protein
MTDFTTITTPRRIEVDRFEADIPDGWQQGRGAFGGLIIGTLARAMATFDAAEERSLRSLTAQLAGPVLPGPNLVQVERLRTGTGVSTLAARLSRDGEVLAHTVGVFGKRRVSGLDQCEISRPLLPPWRDVPVAPIEPPIGPAFARFMELRVVGPLPHTGASEPVASGWVRPKDPGPARDAPFVAAMADAWWPSFFSRMPAPRPAATVAFTLQLLGDLAGLDPEAPLFHRGRTVAGQDGYMVEMRELWGEDGRLLALNQQTFAIVK